MAKITVPDEVINGFAEYGANFFGIYSYNDGVLTSDGIHCITESPFNLNFNLEWVDTPKAGLLKKITSLQSKTAEKAQMFLKNDYTVVPTGDATYVKYAGVKRQSYSAKVKVLNTGYNSKAHLQLSRAEKIEEFLNKNALPLLSNDVVVRAVNNLFKMPTDLADNMIEAMDVIKNTSVPDNDWTVVIADAVFAAMKEYSSKIRDIYDKHSFSLFHAYSYALMKFVELHKDENPEFGANGAAFYDTDMNDSSDAASTFDLYAKIDIEDADNDTIQLQFGHKGTAAATMDTTLFFTKHYWESLDKIDKSRGNEAEFINKVADLYRSWKSNRPYDDKGRWHDFFKEYKIQVNDEIGKYEHDYDYSSVDSEVKKLQEECVQAKEEAAKKIAIATESSTMKENSNNKIVELCDSIINVKPYGEFDHRITPCILFFALGGIIFAEHVLITKWSQHDDNWGYTTEFDISMEKAEVESWKSWCNDIMVKPIP